MFSYGKGLLFNALMNSLMKCFTINTGKGFITKHGLAVSKSLKILYGYTMIKMHDVGL